MARGSVELNEFDLAGSNNVVRQQTAANDDPSPQPLDTDVSLPPIDGGKQAWFFLAACWVVEAFVFGRPSIPSNQYWFVVLTLRL
jgi:hypothetical protein